MQSDAGLTPSGNSRGAVIDHAAILLSIPHAPTSSTPPAPTEETTVFAIDWLRKGILVEKEISVLTSAAEAIAAAKLRAHDLARRHPGQEPDTFRLVDATGKIVGDFPKNPNNQSRQAQTIRKSFHCKGRRTLSDPCPFTRRA
jgi:hypothetical protein